MEITNKTHPQINYIRKSVYFNRTAPNKEGMARGQVIATPTVNAFR